MTINVKCFCGWDFPLLYDFNWLWHTVWVSDSQRAVGFLWHFERCVVLWYFFTTFKLHSHSMPDVTYDNDFYVHHPHARHIYRCHIMINAELLLARLIFLFSDFSTEKIAVSVSCSIVALLRGTCPCQQLNSSRINTGLGREKHLSTNRAAVHF